jgi:hypothetical protein
MSARCCVLTGSLVLLLAWPWGAWAGEVKGVAEDGQKRAGYPQKVACYAVPSDTGHYKGYLVGGGAVLLGHPPFRDEGTWGWDYCGCLIPKRVALLWYHGWKYQGGVGAYRTTGKNLESRSTP